MSKVLFKRVRNKHRTPVGCVVALSANQVGWSKCNMKLDRFNKEFGKKIAIKRAESGKNYNLEDLPYAVREDFERMKERAVSYYK